MLGTHPLGFAGGRLGRHEFVHPVVVAVPSNLSTSAPIDDDAANARTLARGESVIDDGLQRQCFAAPQLLVGGDDERCARVLDSILQALRREPPENHRVSGADARTGLHRDHTLDAHGHVDHDAIALADTLGLQSICETTGALQQLAVGHARDLAAIGLEDDRYLVALARLDLSVEAVVGRVERAVLEPLEEWCLAFVE